MFGLYYANKWKSYKFGKISNKISEILISQGLSTVSILHKVGYLNSSQNNGKIIRKNGVQED